MLNLDSRAESRRHAPASARDDAGDLRRVLAAHPELAAFGWRASWHGEALLTVSRATLAESVREFTRALEFLRAALPQRAWRSSYSLKHIAERWHRTRDPNNNSYISNGALIAAALALGLGCKRVPGSPNSIIRSAPRRP